MNNRQLLRAIKRAATDEAEDLDLSKQALATLPPEIGTLVNLKRLHLDKNKLTALPAEIGKLTNLTTLNLDSNYLTALPPEIGKLTNLTGLDLGNNRLTALSPEIGKLTNLIGLALRANSLTTLPPEIGELTNLTMLFLGINRLTTLPPEIGKLTKLRELYLVDNKLTALPPEIGKLGNLTGLYLWSNQISALPPELAKLTNLTELDLDHNKLTALPREIGELANLISLHLVNNELTALPLEIGELTGLTTLDLNGNPLPIPPEILEGEDDPARIINYYLEHLAGDKRPLNEAKMLVVGQGGVGKTSLVKRLVDDEFDPNENKTEGIDIRVWRTDCDGTQIRLNVWDFGGQEIMHATHQFFLTKRSLYVLVLDARQGEQESRIEYWLKLIQSFSGDSPIIVVSNKSDQHEMDLDWTGLQRKYPAIKGFVRRVSCQTGEGIPELREMVQREVAGLEHIHDELLLNWFTVKSRLEDMRHDYDFITYEKYQEMCAAEGIADEVSMRTLVAFLHDLGIVLHFDDHPILGDTNILNPEWVTKGVYQIINSDLLAKSKGVLNIGDLTQILKPAKNYPKSKHLFIIEMMRKFELCFDFPGQSNQRFLVPELLPVEAPDMGDWDGSLDFEYQYDVLPRSVMSRFIVGMNASIYQNTNWRKGVVLEYEGGRNKALVRADLEDRKIYVHVDGNDPTRRTYLGVIRAELQRIHASISGLAVQQKVSIAGYPGVAVDYYHLLTLEQLGEETFVPEGLMERVNVKQLLDGVVSPEERRELRREGGAERGGDVHYHAEKMYFTRDRYSAEQVAAQGPRASAAHVSFTQSWGEIRDEVDLQNLPAQLAELQNQLKLLASEPEDYDSIGNVARAENAARQNDGPGMLQHLASAGSFALNLGTKVGAELAVALAKAGVGV